MVTYQATDTLTEDDLINLSRVFSTASRPQLIIVKNLLNERHATYRSYENGTVTFDIEAVIREASFRGSLKTASRLAELVSLGVSLQALAKTPLNIPMAGKDNITIRL